MKYLFISTLFLLLFSSCKSVDKLYADQKYKEVINRLDAKAKKGKLDRDEKTLFIKAVNNYFREEQNILFSKIDSEEVEDWEKSKLKLKFLGQERSEILGFNIVRDSDLDPVKFDDLNAAFDSKLLSHYTNEYTDLENEYFATFDRGYIQDAYAAASQMGEFGAEMSMVDSLQKHCLDLGHLVIQYRFIEDEDYSWDFEHEFMPEIKLESDEWNTFKKYQKDADYQLVLAAKIDAAYSNKLVESYTYTREIITHYTESVDTAGFVTRDPVYSTAMGTVNTTKYTWTVEGSASYRYYDLSTGKAIADDDYDVVFIDQDEVYTFAGGDERAIPDDLPLAFTDLLHYDYGNLIDECFEELGEQVNDGIPR